MMRKRSELLQTAIEAAIEAGKAILNIYETDSFGVEQKNDDSPLTLADTAANKVIMSFLNELNIPVISEENKEIKFSKRKEWHTCWMVDPLDGTKEFIKKNGEFTVNIALIEKGQPTMGVIYVPVSKELYFADVVEKFAFKSKINDNKNFSFDKIKSKYELKFSKINKEHIRVVGSRSHMNKDTEDYIAQLQKEFKTIEVVSKGSSLKFCLVAEGKADVYPRYAPTMEWDTAAGHAICNAVGLKVTSFDTKKPLLYNKENLLNSYFLVHK